MRKIRYTCPYVAVLPSWIRKKIIKELVEIPDSDMERLRQDAEECKKRILEARRREKEQDKSKD